MRCVLIKNPGPQSRLMLVEQDTPTPKSQELLIRVHATALNRADLLQRQGKYPPPQGASNIPGLEVAGEVVSIGEQVTQFKTGDQIFGLVAGGGYADYCCVDERLAAQKPQAWSYQKAAAIPEALTTAYATVFHIGQLKPDETFLIHGAGSGIASFALQMARYIKAKTITTIGDELKRSAAETLSADVVYNYHHLNCFDDIGEAQVDVIVDFIGGNYFAHHLKVLKPKGRLIQIAAMKGGQIECHLAPLISKRLVISGFILRSQSINEKADLWKNALENWMTPLIKGQIQPIIDSEFTIQEIENAHQRIQSSEHFGKIIINVEH